MVSYPIRIPRKPYNGSDPRKIAKIQELNEIAAEIETVINDIIKNQENNIIKFTYAEIASITGYKVSTVQDICVSIDGGGNGFTVIRDDLN